MRAKSQNKRGETERTKKSLTTPRAQNQNRKQTEEGKVRVHPCVFPSLSPAHDGGPCGRGVVEPFDGDGEDASVVCGVDAGALHVRVSVELDLPFVVTCGAGSRRG